MTASQAFGRVLRLWQRGELLPLRLAAPAVWASFLWLLSAREGKDAPASFVAGLSHNAGHAILFGTLSALLLLCRPGQVLVRAWWWTCVGLASAYGVVDELHQAFVPGRSSSAGDVITDLCGASAAVAAIVALASGRSRPWWAFGAFAALAAASALVETLR